MKKICFLLLVLLVSLFMVTGCGSEDEKTSEYTFDNLAEDLKSLDSKVQIYNRDATALGGVEGHKYVVASCNMEVYKFDMSSEEYKEAEKNQELTMPMMDMKFEAVVKNGYAYRILSGLCGDVKPYVEKLMAE